MSKGSSLDAVRAAARRGGDWLRDRLLQPDWPTTAVEVRPRSVAVVRLTGNGGGLRLGAAAAMDLPEGVLDVALARNNVLDAAALRKAIEGACERAGALSGGSVALVLPDPTCRVALLSAEDVKVRRRQEAEQMIRFRLNKTVPFDVQQAHVAWAGPVAGQVLVAAIYLPVLEGYETVLQSLGLEAGVVEPASMAIVGTLERASSPGDRLLVNWDFGYVSLVLTRAGWPVLTRTLVGELAVADVLREVGNTVLYYRERLGGQGLESAVLRSTLLPSEEAVPLLRGPLGLEPVVLDPWSPLGEGDTGPASQAMAGAVSCLLRRAA